MKREVRRRWVVSECVGQRRRRRRSWAVEAVELGGRALRDGGWGERARRATEDGGRWAQRANAVEGE